MANEADLAAEASRMCTMELLLELQKIKRELGNYEKGSPMEVELQKENKAFYNALRRKRKSKISRIVNAPHKKPLQIDIHYQSLKGGQRYVEDMLRVAEDVGNLSCLDVVVGKGEGKMRKRITNYVISRGYAVDLVTDHGRVNKGVISIPFGGPWRYI